MKKEQVGTTPNVIYKNITFLIKYGVLIAVLSLSYTFNNSLEKPASNTIPGSEQERSKNKQNILPLYYLIINIL